MSCYEKLKVIRCKVDSKTDVYDLEKKFSELFTNKPGGFSVAPVQDLEYIDYIYSEEYGVNCGEYGFARYLTEKESEKYLPMFKKIIPNIKANNLRCVEFCWYNCSEAKLYYDVGLEEFL